MRFFRYCAGLLIAVLGFAAIPAHAVDGTSFEVGMGEHVRTISGGFAMGLEQKMAPDRWNASERLLGLEPWLLAR